MYHTLTMLSSADTLADMGQPLTAHSARVAIGERIKTAMDCRGYTATMLAEQSGVSMSTIGHLIHGRRVMHLDVARKISNVLGVNPSWIAWGDK